MDDLTTLKGIGKATEKKLHAAGIDSFAKLAAATTDQLNAALVSGGADDWAAMIAEAAKMVPPVQQRQMSEDEVLALVKSWDDARAELNAAGTAVSELQLQYEAAPDDAATLDLATELVAARDRVAAAEVTIAALLPLPEGVRLPDAKKPELPAEQEAVASAPILPALDDQFFTALNSMAEEYGISITAVIEAARLKLAARDDLENDIEAIEGDEGDAIERQTSWVEVDLAADFDGAVSALRVKVLALADTDILEAQAFITGERAGIQEAVQYAIKMDSQLVVLDREITRTETVWPLGLIRFDGEEQPIGKPLKVDWDTFLSLTSSGAASGFPPEHDAQVE